MTTKYNVLGDKVLDETNGTDTIHYTYGANDKLISMNLNGVEYYYIRNGQGDIIGLVDNAGVKVVSYTYDTWGNQIASTDTSGVSLATKNPYRYRGYRYDEETGLYYLNSRYYNTNINRFMSADSYIGDGSLLSHNLYAYTKNNPVNYWDPNGYDSLETDKYGVVAPPGEAAVKTKSVTSQETKWFKWSGKNGPVNAYISQYGFNSKAVFSRNALGHIFNGNINKLGLPSGYHKQSIMSFAKISNVSPTDKFGVYKATVEMNGKTKFSTFFPDSWSRTDVINAIKQARAGVNFNKAGWYTGKANNGMPIKMWLNDKGLVDTAFAIYSK